MEQVLPVGNGSGAERKLLATVEEVKVNLNTELLLTIVKKLDKISTANLEEKEEMFKYLILLPPSLHQKMSLCKLMNMHVYHQYIRDCKIDNIFENKYSF